jgi:hypothetical protein
VTQAALFGLFTDGKCSRRLCGAQASKIQIQGVDAARIIMPVVFVWPDNDPSAMHGELQPRHQSKMKRVRVKTLLEKVQLPPREAILMLVSSTNGGFGVGVIS